MTNARSLAPKIQSLIEYFEEFGSCFCLVSESWIVDANGLEEQLDELEGGTGLKVIYKNRPPKTSRNKTKRTGGGGVAIVYNLSLIHI